MKTLLFLGVVLGSLPLFSQETQVIQRGPDSRIIETTEKVVNDLGETNSIAHRHTEISTGMHYCKNNEWKESNPVFRLVPGAAVADEVQHRFTISHNIVTVRRNRLLPPRRLGVPRVEETGRV